MAGWAAGGVGGGGEGRRRDVCGDGRVGAGGDFGGCAGADEKVSIGGCVGGGAGDDSLGKDTWGDYRLDSDYALRTDKPDDKKRVKGQCPLRGQGAERPCGVWGNAPTVFRALNFKEAANKGAGSEASLPVTKKSSNIVQVIWEATAEGVQRAIGKPSGTMPTTSLIEKSTLAVQKSRYFSLLQGFRLCGGDKGALRSPP